MRSRIRAATGAVYRRLRVAKGGGAPVAAILSDPEMDSIAPDGGIPTVTTDTASGTLYYAVLTNGGSATDAQIKAGAGGNIVAGKAGNKTVTLAGVNTFPAVTGLSASTDYEVVFLQTANGLDSAQAQAGFSTAAPVTTNFNYAAFAPGQTGPLDFITNVTRTYWQADQSASATYSCWMGEITGTDCYMQFRNNNSNYNVSFMNVSVDNGAFAVVNSAAGNAAIFTGLTDTTHLVKIFIGPAYSTIGYVPNNIDIAAITGAVPALSPPTQFIQAFDGKANTYTAGFNSATGGNYTPTNVNGPAVAGYSQTGQIVFRAATSRLILGLAALGTDYAYVSVDGALPTRYGPVTGGVLKVTTDSAAHTYAVWGSEPGGDQTSRDFQVGCDGALQTLAASLRLFQFGDSLTAANNNTTTGQVETFYVAAALGMVAATAGKGGQTVEALNADIATLLAAITTDTANDVAVLAIGRNNVGIWDAGTDAAYLALIVALSAKFGKVLCRGLINGSTGTGFSNSPWTTENGFIQTIVAAYADPNVIYIDPEPWTDIALQVDNTHVTDAGYVPTLGDHCITAYGAVI